MEPSAPAPPQISLGRWLLVVVLPVSIVVGGIVWAYRQGVPERDIWGALHSGNLVRLQKMLKDDPELSRTKVYRQGYEPWRTGSGIRPVQWTGRYLIHDAVMFGMDAALLDALAAAGADLSVRLEGRPLLLEAARNGQASSAAWLLDHGADLQERTHCDTPCEGEGGTALHEAIAARSEPGQGDVIALLLARGAGLEAVDATGQTALHLSAAGSVDTTWVLCRHGALVTARDAQGRTPLDVAMRAEASTPSSGGYGPAAMQDWLKPGGGCEELSALARKRGGPVGEDEGREVFGRFLCARGVQDSCALSVKR